ncbi:MAG: acetyl-CoA carboxylase biotin carboxylase subunit, partial [Actinomadura rubrobrunea]|nr:acetyl-CoA carboxylase biotin carboxylase subunit [Actinomadura rubrobrunea]
AARTAAASVFADERLYVEKYLTSARHIEVQVLADAHGNAVHLGERDCSVQRRHQKLIEESPAPGLDERVRAELARTALAGVRAVGYVSAGTFEYLVDEDGQPYFIEMNTRLQVEHPVTEERTGVDLVAWMLRIAAGDRLDFAQDDIRPAKHVIEARINAEDPDRGWAASAGPVRDLRLPAGPGVRVDTHLFEGYVVPPYYDSLLAKVVVSAATRAEALARLDRALAEFRCAGPATNVAFHRDVLRHPDFRAGRHRLGLADSVMAARAAHHEERTGTDG